MSVNEKKFVIKHVFKDIKRMGSETSKFGEYEKLYNLDWYISLEKTDEHFLIGLFFEELRLDRNYSMKTDYELHVTSEKNKICVLNSCYTYKSSDDSWHKLMTIGVSEIEPQLIDDSMTVEFHVKILEASGFKGVTSKFDESVKKYSDVALVVDGEKFYVSKGSPVSQYLASRSTYFDSLFMGNFQESNQSEIVLNGIEVEHLQNFLEILYLETTVLVYSNQKMQFLIKVFPDETVKSVLHLADMYDTKCVLKQAEQFLLKESKKSTMEKLELAAKYNCDALKKKYLSEIKTVQDILDVLPDDITQMDSGIMAELFKKSLSLH